MLCPNCETENNDDALFCDECGFPLSGSMTRAGGAASPTRVSTSESRRARRPQPLQQDAFFEDDPFAPKQDAPAFVEQEPFVPSRSSTYRWPDEEPQYDAVFDDSNSFGAQDSGPQYGSFESTSGPFPQDDSLGGLPDPGADDHDTAFGSAYDDQDDYDDFFSDDFGSDAGFEMPPPIDNTFDFGDDFWRDDPTSQMPQVNDGNNVPNSKNYRAQSSKRPRKKGRVAVIIVGVLVIVAAAIAIGGFFMGFWGGKAIPDVTGMTEADARSALEAEGFSVKSMQVKSDETEGLVLITDPGSGSHAPEGSEVIIHIATARFVPDIEGKTREEAEALLKDAGYENVKYEVQYTSGPEGIVMSVSPEAGTRAKSSLEIVVKVSENYKVPDISGKDLDGAKKAIEDAGLVAAVAYIDTDQYPDGTVMGTDPVAGTKVNEGDTVTINVSRTRGIELVGLTEEMFKEGGTVTIDGVNWQIESLISVSYQGDDTVSYTATGTPYTSLVGQTVYGSSSTISGTVVWSADNEVVSIG